MFSHNAGTNDRAARTRQPRKSCSLHRNLLHYYTGPLALPALKNRTVVRQHRSDRFTGQGARQDILFQGAISLYGEWAVDAPYEFASTPSSRRGMTSLYKDGSAVCEP